MKHPIFFAVPLLTLAACKTTELALKESGNKPLSALQIEKLLVNSTVVGTTARGFDYTTYFKGDGTMRLKTRKFDETGKWRTMKPDRYCRTLPSLNDGKETCRRWYKTADGYRSVKMDGSHSGDFKVVPGNPRKL